MGVLIVKAGRRALLLIEQLAEKMGLKLKFCPECNGAGTVKGVSRGRPDPICDDCDGAEMAFYKDGKLL